MHRSSPLMGLVALACLLALEPVAEAWTWPATGPVVREFEPKHHSGVDIGGTPGDPVVAPAAGRVTFAGGVGKNGQCVTIETADGFVVTLLHLRSITVQKDATVAEGAQVGTMGASVQLDIRPASAPKGQGYLDPQKLLPPRVALWQQEATAREEYMPSVLDQPSPSPVRVISYILVPSLVIFALVAVYVIIRCIRKGVPSPQEPSTLSPSPPAATWKTAVEWAVGFPKGTLPWAAIAYVLWAGLRGIFQGAGASWGSAWSVLYLIGGICLLLGLWFAVSEKFRKGGRLTIRDVGLWLGGAICVGMIAMTLWASILAARSAVLEAKWKSTALSVAQAHLNVTQRRLSDLQAEPDRASRDLDAAQESVDEAQMEVERAAEMMYEPPNPYAPGPGPDCCEIAFVGFILYFLLSKENS